MNDYESPYGSASTHAASDSDVPLDQQFAGKVAVVTGSTQGLGLTAVKLMLVQQHTRLIPITRH